MKSSESQKTLWSGPKPTTFHAPAVPWSHDTKGAMQGPSK